MKTTTENKLDLMPGLWVGRKLKSPEQRAKHGIAERMPDEAREEYEVRVPAAFSDRFYWNYNRAGIVHQEAIKAVGVGDYKAAVKWATREARLMVARVEAEQVAAKLAQVHNLQEHVKAVKRGQWCSVGALLESLWKVLDRHNLQTMERSFSNLRMVIAVAKGWLVPMAGKRMNEVIKARVDALPSDVICRATAEAYALAVQVANDEAESDGRGGWKLNLNRLNPARCNVTILSNLGMAAVPLHVKYRTGDEVAGLRAPWGIIDTFSEVSLARPEKDVGEELPTQEQYGMMMEVWQVLKGSADEMDREVALVNELFRKLGLRSGEMCMARAGWLVKLGESKYGLALRDRAEEGFYCKGEARATLPVERDLAERLLARSAEAVKAGMVNPFLVLPMVAGGEFDSRKGRNAEHGDRARLVRGDHNRWLKGFIGEAPSGEGNHRLRKVCATGLYWSRRKVLEGAGEDALDAHKIAAGQVQRFLRHKNEATSLLHYIAPDMMEDLGEAVTDGDLVAGLG